MSARGKWVWGAFALAAGLAAWSAADARGFRHYLLLEQEMTSLRSRNRDLNFHNERFIREIEALRKNPEAQERAAREELGFIRPGEVVFNLE